MVSARQDAQLLLIDDDRELGNMLRDFLAPDHLSVTAAASGEDGLATLEARAFDLIILDIMLPGMNGLEVLKAVRLTSDVPIIMLTARGDDVDRIIGLEFGADDYLSKPFNPRELAARIKAILRRAHAAGQRPEPLGLGSITLEPATRRVAVRGKPLRLTGTEYELLRCLLESAGEVVSKDTLSQRALGRRLLPYDRSIDTHISNLRGKLARAGTAGASISNRRGVGYVLLASE